MNGDKNESPESCAEERHRSHWTMKSEGRGSRSLKTKALVHHEAQDIDEDDLREMT
ncbi:hypothetical protein BgiBS90_012794, partial [Biomphalaria glabrata]